jgi:acetyl-CoA carboxylase biotin carboxyl carrier protein
MTLKEIQDLIKLIDKYELSEFHMREGEFELNVKTSKFDKEAPAQIVSGPGPAVPVVSVKPPAPVAETATPQEAPPESTEEQKLPAEDKNLLEIKSPMVGTFYRASAPDKPPYVKVGDAVDTGSVVCIVEAMKLFNEIESEVSGTIVKVLVEDASPVEYDQVLFLVDPA